jgi:hypothetical protein
MYLILIFLGCYCCLYVILRSLDTIIVQFKIEYCRKMYSSCPCEIFCKWERNPFSYISYSGLVANSWSASNCWMVKWFERHEYKDNSKYSLFSENFFVESVYFVETLSLKYCDVCNLLNYSVLWTEEKGTLCFQNDRGWKCTYSVHNSEGS